MLDPTDHTNPFSDEPAGASKPRREPEVRLANAHLGAILNDPQTAHRSAIRARADAIKLLAIAVEHQDRGHAVNWRRCLRDYGLSKSHFHRALAVLVRLGILDRVHHGREFATETLASPSRPGYTALPLKLLTAGSALLAFVASVRLSPTAKPLKEVTARLGIRSKNTGKRLLVEVQTFDPGLVASARGAADTIFVARSANFLPPVKFRDVKFRDVKNREAQSIRENIIPADIKNNLPGLDPARSAGYVPSQQAAGSSREGSASPEERKKVPPRKAKAPALTDWREAGCWQAWVPEAGLHTAKLTFGAWLAWIEALHGGPLGSEHRHLPTREAFEQATSLAEGLVTDDRVAANARHSTDLMEPERTLGVADVMLLAITARMVAEIKRGRRIHSLAFIGQNLVREAYRDWEFSIEMGECEAILLMHPDNRRLLETYWNTEADLQPSL